MFFYLKKKLSLSVMFLMHGKGFTKLCNLKQTHRKISLEFLIQYYNSLQAKCRIFKLKDHYTLRNKTKPFLFRSCVLKRLHKTKYTEKLSDHIRNQQKFFRLRSLFRTPNKNLISGQLSKNVCLLTIIIPLNKRFSRFLRTSQCLLVKVQDLSVKITVVDFGLFYLSQYTIVLFMFVKKYDFKQISTKKKNF